VPSGYDVSNGTYVGWCVDESHTTANNSTKDVYLRNTSYYEGPPDDQFTPKTSIEYWRDGTQYFVDGSWNIVNYILNHKVGDDWNSTQLAIWLFVNNHDWDHVKDDADARTMIYNAIDFGQAYWPAAGEVIAVAVDAGENQGTIIEVTRPVPEASTLLLFGCGLCGLLFFARKKRLIRC